ncbi:bL28 family ribosomal protein [uncultured Neglectibacter sp.]|uniref:large ribosomal subunit protein bL28 n=1 Tax=uncultured Neglectibacter sp. TaxID=1924108 RepID=UPI0034DF3368
MRCEICGKTTTFGKKVAHDRMYINGRTSKKVKPNLQTITVETPKGRRKLKVCTSCMRTMRKQQNLH